MAIRLAIISIFLCAPISAQPVTFVALADPQFGYMGTKSCSQEIRWLSAAFEASEKLKPDFYVISGDMADSYPFSSHRQNQISLFRSVLSTVHRPIYFVPGNHDIGQVPTRQSLREYHREFGPDYYVFEVQGVKFMVLNSTLIKYPAKVLSHAQDQDDFFRKEIAGVQVLFMHHPLYVKSAIERESYFNLPFHNRVYILDYSASNNVLGIFSGHTHYSIHHKLPDMTLLTGSSVCCPRNGARRSIIYGTLNKSGLDYYELPVE